MMKRLVILLPLLAGLGMPMWDAVHAAPAVAFELTELPWSTVHAVLKKVTTMRPYTYEQLVSGYDTGWVTMAQLGSGYEVRITVDGALDVLIIEGV